MKLKILLTYFLSLVFSSLVLSTPISATDVACPAGSNCDSCVSAGDDRCNLIVEGNNTECLVEDCSEIVLDEYGNPTNVCTGFYEDENCNEVTYSFYCDDITCTTQGDDDLNATLCADIDLGDLGDGFTPGECEDPATSTCGDGTCTEGCDVCVADCGSCPTPTPDSGSCGDGTCTEGCDVCVADCGACPGPGPTPTPGPTPFCGDGSCAGGESCGSCPSDCGACLVTGNITGTVYDDPNRNATAPFPGDICGLSGASAVEPGPDAFAYALGSNSDNIAADGTFVIPFVPTGSGYFVGITDLDPDYTCSCPSGCFYSNISSPQFNVNFFVTQSRTAWFQTIGASIHAETNIISPVPGSAINPYTLLRDDAGTINSSGFASYGSGNSDFNAQEGIQEDGIDEDSRDVLAVSTQSLPKENYSYFFRLFEMGLNPTSDLDNFGNDPLNIAKPTNPPNDSKNAYFYSGDLTIDSTSWSVGVGEILTIFINGNLTVKNTTQVAEGGFLAFITSGNINFDETLGSADETSTIALAEGVFIADGTITVDDTDGSGDSKFIGEGIFVGWDGITLGRDYDDGGVGIQKNSFYPVDLFRYRPDFAINIPTRFQKPVYSWQEVAP